MPAQASLASKPSLTLKRHLNASPEAVYAAWTDPKKIAQWFGPEQTETLHTQADARVGGKFRILMRGPDGKDHDVSGVYRQVVPCEKLVFTWVWSATPERESLVTIQSKPDGDGSMLTLIHEQFFDEAARDLHREGWTGCLNKLGRYLA
jgi:uncharacterized protein YndB with AHSA1/START domain